MRACQIKFLQNEKKQHLHPEIHNERVAAWANMKSSGDQ